MEDQVARDHLKAITSKVSQFHRDDAHCDIEIHVQDSVFKCHRLILAAATPYFDVMFGGKFKEGSTSEVTLKDVVQPQIFGEIVKFIYTGKVSINNDNLYPLVRASDFFVLPSIRKLCMQYVQLNVAALLHHGLEMFSYTRATGQINFSQFICRYVFYKFDYFSKTREFLEIPFEDLGAILKLIPGRPAYITFQDVYMHAIMRWIRHTDRSPQNMKSHFDELFKLIKVSELSLKCMGHLIRLNIDDLIALRQNEASNYEIQSSPHAIDSEMKEDAYSDDNKSKFVTSVFSLRDQSGGATVRRLWVNSFQFGCTKSHRFIRTLLCWMIGYIV